MTLDQSSGWAAVAAVLDWVKASQSASGGIRGWQEDGEWAKEYPEITGYIIPTLVKFQEPWRAHRCADYLVSVQLEGGAFPSVGGNPTLFDTAAAAEGLGCAYQLFLDRRYSEAWYAAAGWMDTRPKIMQSSPLYNTRASAIMNRHPASASWEFQERAHYLAYWLEAEHRGSAADDRWQELTGSLMVPDDGLLCYHYEPGWKPVGNRKDICATLQVANLFAMRGRLEDAVRMFTAVLPHIQANGGVPLDPANPKYVTSWCAKFFLDAAWTLLH